MPRVYPQSIESKLYDHLQDHRDGAATIAVMKKTHTGSARRHVHEKLATQIARDEGITGRLTKDQVKAYKDRVSQEAIDEAFDQLTEKEMEALCGNSWLVSRNKILNMFLADEKNRNPDLEHELDATLETLEEGTPVHAFVLAYKGMTLKEQDEVFRKNQAKEFGQDFEATFALCARPCQDYFYSFALGKAVRKAKEKRAKDKVEEAIRDVTRINRGMYKWNVGQAATGVSLVPRKVQDMELLRGTDTHYRTELIKIVWNALVDIALLTGCRFSDIITGIFEAHPTNPKCLLMKNVAKKQGDDKETTYTVPLLASTAETVLAAIHVVKTTPLEWGNRSSVIRPSQNSKWSERLRARLGKWANHNTIRGGYSRYAYEVRDYHGFGTTWAPEVFYPTVLKHTFSETTKTYLRVILVDEEVPDSEYETEDGSEEDSEPSEDDGDEEDQVAAEARQIKFKRPRVESEDGQEKKART